MDGNVNSYNYYSTEDF